eukprot:2924134-Amphidinium_carterae.1
MRGAHGPEGDGPGSQTTHRARGMTRGPKKLWTMGRGMSRPKVGNLACKQRLMHIKSHRSAYSARRAPNTVSYTHLTLPTILLV